MVSFINRPFRVVKLKISKVLRTDTASTKQPFLGGFAGPYSPPQYGPILSKFSPEVVLKQAKTLFENFLKDLSIYGKGTDPKLALLVQLWPIFTSWGWPKSKKISSSVEKYQSLNHPNISKWSLYLNIYIYKYIHIHIYIYIYTYIHNSRLIFAIFGIFLPGNRVGSQVKGVKSKFDKYYFIHTIHGHLPVQKIWFKYFPVLRL